MKKTIAAVLVFLLLFSAQSVFAFTYPTGFWQIQTAYEQALNSKNHSAIIEHANAMIALMQAQPDSQTKHDVLESRYLAICEAYEATGDIPNLILANQNLVQFIQAQPDSAQKRDMLVSRYDTIAKLYVSLGNYENAAIAYQSLIDYAAPFGDAYYDYVKGAQIRAKQYTSETALYTDKGTPMHHGAKNEPASGVLFGIAAAGESLPLLSNSSMILIYQELGQDILGSNINYMKMAREQGKAVEFALNCPNEGYDIDNIYGHTESLEDVSALLAEFPEVPVYLRFGAEFDVWTHKTTPEAFQQAFRYAADYFHQRNPNVAMVWSPNHVSPWGTDVNDFYPGDAYVDWVGMALYAQPYFGGDPQSSADLNLTFNSGINANPVLAARDLIETYGAKKPIMIAEGGCAHTLLSYGNVMQYTAEFGAQRLQEHLAYLPMVYPEIRLMAYFDWYVQNGNEPNDFRLSTNGEMQNIYLQKTAGGPFIQNGYGGKAAVNYRKIQSNCYVDSVFPVYCYAHKYGTQTRSVTYFIDDQYVGMSNQIPYTVYVNGAQLAGNRTLKALIQFADGSQKEHTEQIVIGNAPQPIQVTVSGNLVEFDQPPVLYNDRTLVPMRKIFEALGATVRWDDAARTAVGVLGDRTVSVTVDSSLLMVSGNVIQLDTPPILLSDRTLVPARAVAEGLGCTVGWDAATNTVIIE